ncbi:MAG: hypothetical protein ACOCWH_00515 [Spirochaetota bacterium]
MKQTDTFRKISYRKANKILAPISESRVFDREDAALSFYYHDGSLEIDGDLSFDCHDIVIVAGDLTVNGIVQDRYLESEEFSRVCLSDYSMLYVFGKMKCRHLVSGSFMYVGGDLSVDGTVYVNSHGIDVLHVNGTLTADIFIDEGHLVDCGTLRARRIYVTEINREEYSGLEQVTVLTSDLFLDPSVFVNGRMVPEAVIRKLFDGGRIFTGEG